jgi:RES domain
MTHGRGASVTSHGIPEAQVDWRRAFRIVRSSYPPIDLFEDIADPADWPLLIAAEQKTNPRVMETIGNLDMVPPERRVSGAGASYLMSPFTHVSADRPSRFSDGSYGVLYAGNRFEVALLETVHHHGRFMARTKEPAGWTSQFREVIMTVRARLHDLRGKPEKKSKWAKALDPENHLAGQVLGKRLYRAGSGGVVFPSQRWREGACVGLFYPDLAKRPVQGRHLDYHWDGKRIDLYRDVATRTIYRIVHD